MNTFSNYQPSPQPMGRNHVQRCQSCKEGRENLQRTFWLAYSLATCIGCSFCGLMCGGSYPDSLMSGVLFTGCCASRCWNKAGASVDKCLKERKCCHFDNLPFQPDYGESDSSGARATDARGRLLVNTLPSAQFGLITVQPDSNSVQNPQGCLTSPYHSVSEDNVDSNGADAINTTADFTAVDIIEDFLIGYGTQPKEKEN
ncbi:hypothetical protein [Endozoicomonas sp. ONNA2]|uniref:hypothetical protein n=1 Tax=Endozoicomonas sp. ONNA2 TaxID=2828741 RepID=UPI0021486451|nr:hypothetical protein [Endozoicomonas sp. ONNA2]